MTSPSAAGQPERKMPGMPPSAKSIAARVIGIVLLGIVIAILVVGASGHLIYAPPTDCAEQIAQWSVDETNEVDPGCQ
jgi:hypothetical protein